MKFRARPWAPYPDPRTYAKRFTMQLTPAQSQQTADRLKQVMHSNQGVAQVVEMLDGVDWVGADLQIESEQSNRDKVTLTLTGYRR